MAAPDTPVNVAEKFALVTEHWSPKTVGEINDMQLKVAKVRGEFVWHSHDDTDEFFLVHRGTMTIQLRGRDDVTLGPGDFFVVPQGVEHRPIAADECEILLLEPTGVVNTGDAAPGELTAEHDWI